MINLQPSVSAQEHSGSFFVLASFYLNEMTCTMHFSSILCPNFIFLINSLPILHFFSFTYRYRNNEHENDSTNSLGLDFERAVYAGEFSNDKGMEDDDLPPDLLRLVAQDEKQILPHQEITEAINLRTEEEKREVKIRTTLSPTIREKLIDLF